MSQSAKFISSVNGILQEKQKQMQTAIRFVIFAFIYFLPYTILFLLIFYLIIFRFIWFDFRLCLIFLVYHILCFIVLVSFYRISAAHTYTYVLYAHVLCFLYLVVCRMSVKNHSSQLQVIATKRITKPCPSMHIINLNKAIRNKIK